MLSEDFDIVAYRRIQVEKLVKGFTVSCLIIYKVKLCSKV